MAKRHYHHTVRQRAEFEWEGQRFAVLHVQFGQHRFRDELYMVGQGVELYIGDLSTLHRTDTPTALLMKAQEVLDAAHYSYTPSELRAAEYHDRIRERAPVTQAHAAPESEASGMRRVRARRAAQTPEKLVYYNEPSPPTMRTGYAPAGTMRKISHRRTVEECCRELALCRQRERSKHKRKP